MPSSAASATSLSSPVVSSLEKSKQNCGAQISQGALTLPCQADLSNACSLLLCFQKNRTGAGSAHSTKKVVWAKVQFQKQRMRGTPLERQRFGSLADTLGKLSRSA